MMQEIISIFVILIGIAASLGIVKFAPGYHKAWGLPTGIVFIIIGAAIAGWIEIPWL